MKKKSKLYLMSLSVMLFSVMLFSQGKGPEPPAPPPPPGLPIDGGLAILLAAGVAYGVFEKKRKK